MINVCQNGAKEKIRKAVNPVSCKTFLLEKHLQRVQVCLADPLRTRLSHIRAALDMWVVTLLQQLPSTT